MKGMYIMKTVAIIGCGRIANSAHLPALSQIDEVRIKYACDLLIEKAEAAKEKFPKMFPKKLPLPVNIELKRASGHFYRLLMTF